MPILIDTVRQDDLPSILDLNQSEVPRVGAIDIARLAWFARHSDRFLVARDTARIAGFLIALQPGSDYSSPNYRWFCQHFDDFVYIDRVAIAPGYRRRGIASLLYRELSQSLGATRTLTCEVNVRPPNDESMHFHRVLGFVQVGTLTSPDGEKEVALMARAAGGVVSANR